MQFGGLRTDLNLKPVGNPHNIYIKLSDDVLPDPEAILVTGITPQKTRSDGISEAEFLELFHEQIATKDTVFVGFNTLRFDDEFMRFLNYRNFYDPYEWQWKDGRSRWDLLDVVRMTRALRPEGINWPFDPTGSPSNRLELLTSVNKLDHAGAHDALKDTEASLSLARLIRSRQPKLFDFMFMMRTKDKIKTLVSSEPIFIYTSGKYPSEYEKTTLVTALTDHPNRQGVLVYDLRANPDSYINLKPEEIARVWKSYKTEENEKPFPVKTLQFNRCPAVAPLSVLDKDSQKRLQLDLKQAEEHHQKIAGASEFKKNLTKAIEILDKKQQEKFFTDEQAVDAQLYEGFFDNKDRQAMRLVRAAEPTELGDLVDNFTNNRLRSLLPLYKARNFPSQLTSEEQAQWQTFRSKKLLSGGPKSRLADYFSRIENLKQLSHLTKEQQFALTELELWGQSIMPESY